MKQSWLVYLFVSDLLAELFGVYTSNDTLRLVTKPLLLLILISLVLAQNFHKRLWKNLLLAALFFSLGGDVLLQFEKHDGLFFIFGLGSFLIAHLFYLLLFTSVWKNQWPRPLFKLWAILLMIAYLIIMLYLLFPELGNLKIPVSVYAVCIASMLVAAVHAFHPSGKWVVVGAILFVLSDSILALNKFHSPLAYAGLLIMSTYAIAQLLIVTGFIKFTQSIDKH